MIDKIIPYGRQHITDEDIQAVVETLKSDYLTQGPKIKEFEIKSVERIPHKLKQGVLYVCLECQVAVHLCACGCGEKTVTPLGENGWNLTFDENGLSLNPSIGNFNIPCKSHYFIKDNKVRWC